MVTNDMVNALFEFSGALFILGHCRALYKTKDSSAVSMLATLFFLMWGIWNLYWFPYIHMMWSYGAGMLMAAANAFWISMIIHYRRK